jgi:predicted metal-dependent hydrolase
VRAPKWVTLREVDAAVREKGAWIVAKLVAQG